MAQPPVSVPRPIITVETKIVEHSSIIPTVQHIARQPIYQIYEKQDPVPSSNTLILRDNVPC